MTGKTHETMTRQIVENMDIPNDHGGTIRVSGAILAEDMHFNDRTGMLTVEKVYDAGPGKMAYAAISAVDNQRDRRAYLIEERGERCLASNGSITLDLRSDDLIHLLALALEENRQSSDQSRNGLEHIQRKLAANA
ncbi:MAG: hypothetical protein AB7E32_02030 [Desulfovibrio sp.]